MSEIFHFWLSVCASVREIVRDITSKVIVVFPYNLVNIFIMMRRRVTYKTNDSMSKVKVTIEVKGHNIVIFTLIGP